MNFFIDVFYKTEIDCITAKVNIMSQLSEPNGFYQMYQSVSSSFNDCQAAFNYVNGQYKLLFGCYRYQSFASFEKRFEALASSRTYAASRTVTMYGPEYLKAWFVIKGFDHWISFKALVSHYYPETSEAMLYQFWVGAHFDDKIIKNVNYVKQIIG